MSNELILAAVGAAGAVLAAVFAGAAAIRAGQLQGRSAYRGPSADCAGTACATGGPSRARSTWSCDCSTVSSPPDGRSSTPARRMHYCCGRCAPGRNCLKEAQRDYAGPVPSPTSSGTRLCTPAFAPPAENRPRCTPSRSDTRRPLPGLGGGVVAIASNESFSGWTKTFTDPRLCAAIVDHSPSVATSSRPAPTPSASPPPAPAPNNSWPRADLARGFVRILSAHGSLTTTSRPP